MCPVAVGNPETMSQNVEGNGPLLLFRLRFYRERRTLRQLNWRGSINRMLLCGFRKLAEILLIRSVGTPGVENDVHQGNSGNCPGGGEIALMRGGVCGKLKENGGGAFYRGAGNAERRCSPFPMLAEDRVCNRRGRRKGRVAL